MRIFLALASSPVPGLASNLWTRNLHDPLVDLGNDVVLWDDGIQPLFDLDPEAPETVAPRRRLTESLLAAVESAQRASPLDLILVYLTDSHVEPDAIDTLGKRFAPVVHFSCNNIHQFHLVRRVCGRCAACLVPEREALPRFRAAGARPIYFPMAAHPEVYRPLDVPVIYDATFAGQRYADRASAVLALREAGVDAHAFGKWWPAEGVGAGVARAPWAGIASDLLRLAAGALRGRSPLRAARDRRDLERLRGLHPNSVHAPVSDDEYVALFSRGRVSLGFSILGDTHRTRTPLRQVRLREFEGPMSGAFYLTEWIEELADLYDIGREIVCYRSHEEMVDRCRYYLAHDAERERIARAGLERARRDHTWHRRFEGLFETLAREGVLAPR